MVSRWWQGRPVGFLVAWLRAQARYTSRGEHFALPKDASALTFEARRAAREWLATSAGLSPADLEALLAVDRPQRPEEPGPEPDIST